MVGEPRWIVRDVRDDGSCFFRALYQSSLRTGNLKRIIRRLKHASGNSMVLSSSSSPFSEDEFVKEARKALATIIVNDTSTIPAIHAHLRSVYKESPETYSTIIEAYPEWFQKHFARMPKRLETLKLKLAKYIVRMNSWVSEIEIRILLDILTAKGKSNSKQLRIIIFNQLPSVKAKLDCTTIYLLNLEERHYNYILCRDCEPKVINPKTKRCIKKNGTRATRILRGVLA